MSHVVTHPRPIVPALTPLYAKLSRLSYPLIRVATGLILMPHGAQKLFGWLHLPNGFFWNAGGYEYPLLWSLIALAIAFKGGADLSLDRALGREF